MSKQCWLQLVKQHLDTHPGLFTLLARAGCYTLALLVIMWASANFFGDTYAANISLFAVFAVSFELLWSSSPRGARFYWYVASILCLGMCGVVLVHQSMGIASASCQMKCVSKGK